MKFSKDLRDLNEKEFREVYSYLEKKTDGFKRISPELILENPQYILIFRLCTGLSQKEFAKKLGVTKDWCRHTEAKRNKIIHMAIAERYNKKIEILLNKNEIIFEETSITQSKYMFSRDQVLPEIKMKVKSISKISEEKLKELYEITKERTNNFTKFNPQLLSEIPQSLLIFRIIFREDHRIFAKKLKVCGRGLRRYESGKCRIRSRTGKIIMQKISEMFSERKIKDIGFDQLLENKRVLTNFFGNRNIEAMMKHGLNILAKLPQSDFEKEIAKTLKKHSIPFEQCAVIDGVKKRYNIDFVIPNTTEPKIAIEVFNHTMGGKSRNTRGKVRSIDHRFQSIKIKNPNIKTMMIAKLSGRPILLDFVKKKLEMEILNTNKLIINEEIQNLPEMIKKHV
jgi:hypothetical protein